MSQNAQQQNSWIKWTMLASCNNGMIHSLRQNDGKHLLRNYAEIRHVLMTVTVLGETGLTVCMQEVKTKNVVPQMVLPWVATQICSPYEWEKVEKCIWLLSSKFFPVSLNLFINFSSNSRLFFFLHGTSIYRLKYL